MSTFPVVRLPPSLCIVWSSASAVRAAMAGIIDLVGTERSLVPNEVFDLESLVYESRHSSFGDGVVVLCGLEDPPGDVAVAVTRLRRDLLWEGGIVVVVDRPLVIADTKLFANIDAPLRDAPGVMVCDAISLGAIANALSTVSGCTREQWSDYANALGIKSYFDELYEAAQAAFTNGNSVRPLVVRMQATLERVDWDLALDNHRTAAAARALLREPAPQQKAPLVEFIGRLRKLATSLEA